MADRRGFVAGVAALLAGGPQWLRQSLTKVSETPEIGVWRDSSDPGELAAVIIVDGRLLWCCRALNEEAQMVEVDLSVPVPGKEPTFCICDDHFVTRRLGLNGALKVYRDGLAHPNNGRRYWTNSGWVDEKSEPIPGPFVSIIEQHVAGEDLSKDAAVYVRNGRVYLA